MGLICKEEDSEHFLHSFPSNSFGFELSRRKGLTYRDIFVCIHGKQLTELKAWLRARTTYNHTAWLTIHKLITAAEDCDFPLRIWLEFDAQERNVILPLPSLFLGSTRGVLDSTLFKKTTLKTLIGNEFQATFDSQDFQSTTGCKYIYIGRMYSRQPDSLRLCYLVTNPREARSILARFDIELPEDLEPFFKAAALRAMYLSIDPKRTDKGHFGFELLPDREYPTEDLHVFVSSLEIQTRFDIKASLANLEIADEHVSNTASLFGVNRNEWHCSISHIKLSMRNEKLLETKPYCIFNAKESAPSTTCWD